MRGQKIKLAVFQKAIRLFGLRVTAEPFQFFGQRIVRIALKDDVRFADSRPQLCTVAIAIFAQLQEKQRQFGAHVPVAGLLPQNRLIDDNRLFAAAAAIQQLRQTKTVFQRHLHGGRLADDQFINLNAGVFVLDAKERAVADDEPLGQLPKLFDHMLIRDVQRVVLQQVRVFLQRPMALFRLHQAVCAA